MMILGSGLGIILSLVFGCLLLALIAELYYLLWWKKARGNTPQTDPEAELNTKDAEEAGPTKDLGGVEAELLRLQNRLLFTIKEETREDLESDDAKSNKASRGRSLSDLILAVETPHSLDGCRFNPLFESSSSSSPPPKFKFLRDAEEKLYRRLLLEAAHNKPTTTTTTTQSHDDDDEEERELRNGSFIRIIVGNGSGNFSFHSSSSAQVIPLPSSPTSVVTTTTSEAPHRKPTCS